MIMGMRAALLDAAGESAPQSDRQSRHRLPALLPLHLFVVAYRFLQVTLVPSTILPAPDGAPGEGCAELCLGVSDTPLAHRRDK
jgi:hypothetical protein